MARKGHVRARSASELKRTMRVDQSLPLSSSTAGDAVLRGAPQPVHRLSRAAAAGSAVLATVALVAGDAAMAGVAVGARAVVPGPAVVEWLAAAGVIAVGSHVLVGLPQLALGRRHGAMHDRRGRWAVRLLGRDPGGLQGTARTSFARVVAFVVASVVAGPLAIGWISGRRGDAEAHLRTATSAALFGAVWAAVYLGAIAAVF
jgi:hypothetical protein